MNRIARLRRRAFRASPTRPTLSERDSLRILPLLENPPAAAERLVRAAKAGFVLPIVADADALKRGI
jgi:uncharacterized protein (DUF1778 family)